MPTNVLGELKQRNVIRVAGAYAVTGWALFQIVNSLFPALLLPKWAVTLVAVLLLAGFPVALIIAWAFERTPEGIRRTATGAAAPPPGLGRLDWVLAAATLAIVALTTAQFATRGDAPAETTVAAADRSVAVLPFVSFGDDSEQGFFADGLTEEIINGLAQLPELKVAGRTSSFYFKGRNEDLRGIGAKLGVAHVLEGSIRRSGPTLRITAQLIKVADGYHVWSQTFDRPIGDALAVQTEISSAVAKVLASKLIGPESAAPARSAEAVRLELTAKARLHSMGLADTTAAREIFGRLVRLEPANADAHAGYALATMHLVQDHLAIDFKTGTDEALAAVAKALSLSPDAPMALRAKGFAHRVLAIRTGNPRHHEVALAAQAKAVRVSPRDPDILALYAAQLQSAGRNAEALTYARRAVALDPLSRSAQTMLGIILEALGRFDDAGAQYAKTAALFPDYASVQLSLAQMRIAQGRLDLAVAPLSAARKASDDIASGLILAHVYANLGMEREMQATLAGLPDSPISSGLVSAIRNLHARNYAALVAEGEKRHAAAPDPLWASTIAAGALLGGDAERARAVMAKSTPALFLPEPASDAGPHEIMFVASALDAVGDKAQARRLLQLVLATTKPQTVMPDGTLVVSRVNALAGLGDKAGAIRELAAAIDAGYRSPIELETFTHLSDYPLMRTLRYDAGYATLIERIETDNARMRARLTRG